MSAAKPLCFEVRPGLDLRTKEHLALVQAEYILWADIPPHHQGMLSRYFEKHINPGYTMGCLLRCDLSGFESEADQDSLDALPAMKRWLSEFAPEQAWGDEEAVSDWLSGTPNTDGTTL